ncbi:MAG: MFS transporter [Terrimicrobiaceae bacterium]
MNIPTPPTQSDDKKKIWSAGTLVYTSGGLAVLFFWLLWGDFANGMKERAIGPMAQVMLRSLESPDWLVGLLVGSIPAGIGMLLGPVISVLSDRHRSRWGRRIPFLLVSTPVATLGLLGLAFTPHFGSGLHHLLASRSPGEMACKVMAFSFFWAAFEIGSIIVSILFGALVNDVVPQKIIGRFFSLFRAVGLIAGILFNYYLMGLAQTHFFAICIGLVLLFGGGFTLMCMMVKEGLYEAPAPKPQMPSKGRFTAPLTAYFRECFTEPFYLWFFLATTMGMLALGPVNAFSIFHGRSLGMGDDFYGKCLALSYGVSLALTYPLGSLADRFHPVRMGIAGMGVYAVITLYGFFFASTAWTFAIAFVLHTVVAGIYLTGTASIMQRLLPNAKFAQIASAAGLIGAVCSMILPPALGLFIGLMGRNYNYVFILASILAAGSVCSYVVVLSKFQSLGGDHDYHPPGQA